MKFVSDVTDNQWVYDSLVVDVEVDGPVNVFTGLLDSKGTKIYRTPPPIGFGRDKEWKWETS